MSELERARVAERLLALTRVPVLDGLRPEQLPLLARTGREQVFARRTVLAREGEQLLAFSLPLAGRLVLRRHPLEWGAFEALARLGILGVLAGRAMPADLIAEAGTVAFILDLDALRSLLDENGALSRQLLRSLAAEVRSVEHDPAWARRGPIGRLPVGGDLVSRMLVLRETLGLGVDGMTLVSRLARVAREIQLGPGMAAPDTAEHADVLILVRGRLREIRTEGEPAQFESGDVIGISDAVAGMPGGGRITALLPSSALLIPYSELSEAISDDDLLCFELTRAFAGALWDFHARRQDAGFAGSGS